MPAGRWLPLHQPLGVHPEGGRRLFEKPGVITANGAISTEYAIVFPAADMAALKEGDAITVAGTKFKVRETPMSTSSSSGYFKRAPLTAIK